MSEPTPPMTDEQIQGLVSMVEAAEVMASSLNVSASKALFFMLKSMQTLTRMQQRGLDISGLPTSGKPS
jgi:hypothetical protein